MKTNDKKTNKIRSIDVVAIIAGVIVIIYMSYGVYLFYKSYSHQPILTTQISMNSDGGILTINATFSNINRSMSTHISTWYSSYNINSATEELPNGTIISPATSYVQKQIQIDCQKYIYLGNSNYYSC